MNSPAAPPIRDPRYAGRRFEIEHRPDGTIILGNPTPYSDLFQTTNAALDHWAKAAPDALWLAERAGDGWRKVTYGQAHDVVEHLAGSLKGLGLGPERPLLILARNGIDHALIAYAAMRIGAPAAPVSPQYGQKGANPERLAHAVALIRPGAVFVDDRAAFDEALAAPAMAGLTVIAAKGARAGEHLLADLIAEGPATPDSARPDQIAKLLLTSGSTGRPKAVIGTQGNIALNAAQIAACYADPEPPVVVNSAPWSHSLGANAILHMVLHRGGSLYIDAGQPVAGRFDETLRNLREISTTYHNMVPAGWALLAGELERDEALARVFFERVRVLQYGGAGLAQSVCDRIQAVALRTVGEQITFATGYGSTETGPTACNVHWENLRTGMIGLPVPGTTVKLAPQDGKHEIRVKGPQVSPGYHNAGPDLADPFDEEGYYRLGDAAKLIDPERPELGMIFDGRLVENFKLASGTFVTAGALRLTALSAIGGAALDAVVCGEGREGVGLLLFIDPATRARLTHDELRAQIRAGLERMNAAAKGSGGKIARALILEGAPDAHSGEITDKGYINQALARARRPAELERLFADAPDPEVLVF
ncbi:MAG: feruloyl-CoA synthase [Caulobacteraceae bacterium]|nr:feruloyl-CoA synthase [Caulobacteraceae bacterium]